MKIAFKDLPEGFFKAKVIDVEEDQGPWGPYLRIVFGLIDDNLQNYRFSGLVKPVPFKQSKFYRWVSNILGTAPDDSFSTNDIIGKECQIFLSKKNGFYCVIDVSMKPGL